MEVYVITEYDLSFSTEVIGVTDSPKKAEQLIDEYYKYDNVIVKEFEDVRDSGIEFVIKLYFERIDKALQIIVTSHNLNELQ